MTDWVNGLNGWIRAIADCLIACISQGNVGRDEREKERGRIVTALSALNCSLGIDLAKLEALNLRCDSPWARKLVNSDEWNSLVKVYSGKSMDSSVRLDSRETDK